MKQQEVFKRIGIIINELKQQYDYLSETEGKLNDLEIELFVANAHFLADHSEVLSKLNLQNTTPPPPPEKPKSSHEEKYFEPLVQQVRPAPEDKPAVQEPPLTPTVNMPDKAADTGLTNIAGDDTGHGGINLESGPEDTGDDYSFIRKQEPGIIKHELILDESEDWDEDDDEGFQSGELADEPEEPEERPINKTPAAIPAKSEPPAPTITSEPVQVPGTLTTPERTEIKPQTVIIPDAGEKPLTINQRMSAQLNPAGRISEQLNTQLVTDLKQAINLNDKLLYVRDLFNGYSLAYSEVIDILNRFTTFDEADKFLKSNYAVKNNWDSKQATVDKFYGLLKRRYL